MTYKDVEMKGHLGGAIRLGRDSIIGPEHRDLESSEHIQNDVHGRSILFSAIIPSQHILCFWGLSLIYGI
jgi:hypothetical protein